MNLKKRKKIYCFPFKVQLSHEFSLMATQGTQYKTTNYHREYLGGALSVLIEIENAFYFQYYYVIVDLVTAINII